MKFGIIGLDFGKNYLNALADIPGSHVEAVCSKTARDQDYLNNLFVKHPNCKYHTTDYKVICSDPNIDTIVVASPVYTHKEFILTAIHHAKNVIAEKPLVSNSSDFYYIKNVVKESGKSFLVNYIHLFNPDFVKLKKQLTDKSNLFIHSNHYGV